MMAIFKVLMFCFMLSLGNYAYQACFRDVPNYSEAFKISFLQTFAVVCYFFYIEQVTTSIVLPDPIETPHSKLSEEETLLAKELQKEEEE